MTKKLCLGLLLLLSFTNVRLFAQKRVAFYDANTLADLFLQLQNEPIPKKIPVDDPSVTAILKGYSSAADLRVMVSSNPFLASYFNTNVGFRLSVNYGKTLAMEPLQLGSFDISKIADGVAQFLIVRGKEEVKIAFFDRLATISGKYPECKILFPNTTSILLQFDSWAYANILNTLREAMNKDLKGLPGNIARLASLTTGSCSTNDQDCNTRITNINNFFNTNTGIVLLAALEAGDGIISGTRIPDIIEEIFGPTRIGKPGILDANQTLGANIILTISQALKSNEFDQHYVSRHSIDLMLSNPVSRDLFLGLIYQQLTESRIAPADAVAYMQLVIDYVNEFSEKAERMGIAYRKLRDAIQRGESDLKAYYQGMFTTTTSLFMVLGSVQKIDITYRMPVEVTSMFGYIQNTLTVAHDLAASNYSAAIAGLVHFITQVYPNLAKSEYMKSFVRYASFTANLVEAKDASQAQAAIEAISLPAGSASIKKNTGFSISLNAYIGGFFGTEYLKVPGAQPVAKSIAGVYAPIGVAFNFRIKKASISIFGSVIDLGTFASFRLSDSTTKDLPPVTFQNILAPGGGIVFGIPYIPLSIGYTYQYGPALRELSSGVATVDQSNHRTQFFLAIDIPIVNIFSSVRK